MLNNNNIDWINAAIECFRREFGTHPTNWDESQLLHEIREYYTEEQCKQYVTESDYMEDVLCLTK